MLPCIVSLKGFIKVPIRNETNIINDSTLINRNTKETLDRYIAYYGTSGV